MAPCIQVYRISLVWTDVELAQPDVNAPLGKLRRRADYEATIDRLRTVNGHEEDLRLPWWRKTPPHFFWLYYFNRLLPERVTGSTAWQGLAPLRLAAPMSRLQMPGGLSGELHGYIAPQAIALVADIKVVAALPPAEWVEQCHAIRNGRLDVTVPGGAATQMRLQEAATEARERLRALLGQGPGERALAEPFSVVTMVKAEGLSAEQAPAKAAWQWVHAVAAWPAVWRSVAADPSNSIPLRRRDLTKGDLLYGATRGRVLWMPSRALLRPTGRPISTMSCYHHNIALASMQIEMLLDFVRALKGAAEKERLAWSSAGQRAAGLLGRLHGGTDDTYRSASVSRQIKDSGLIETINSLRALHNMKKLNVATNAQPVPAG